MFGKWHAGWNNHKGEMMCAMNGVQCIGIYTMYVRYAYNVYIECCFSTLSVRIIISVHQGSGKMPLSLLHTRTYNYTELLFDLHVAHNSSEHAYNVRTCQQAL